MKEQKKMYKWYYIAALVIALIQIAEVSVLLQPENLLFVALITAPIGFFWNILNIVMIVMIVKKKIEKKGLVIPILFLSDIIFSTIVGAIFGAKAILSGADPLSALKTPLAISLSILIPLAIVIISIIFLKKE